ncbi:MAG: hypothetical protein O7G87_23410, partial [bacterium]|nr:hypothetical protein [bacterium]
GLGMSNGGKIWMIIDIPSVIMIVGLTLGISWQAGTPLKLVIRSFFWSNLTAEEIKIAASGWAQVRTFVMVAGVIGSFVGLVVLFNHAQAAEHFLLGVATAAIPMFYAVVLSCGLFLPLQRRLEAQVQG